MATADHEATDDSSGVRHSLVWDCGSALYDSYELTTFERQLDAAVSRSLSMPHLTTTTAADDDAQHQQHQQHQQARGRRRRRLPALLRRVFSKVLRLRLMFPAATGQRGARYHHRTGDDGAGSPWSGALTSIPEEQSSSSPEMGASSPVDPAGGPSKLRKAQSERFVGNKTASSVVQFEVVL